MTLIDDYETAKASISSEQKAADDAARAAFEAAEALDIARSIAQAAADALESAKRSNGYDTARKALLGRLSEIGAKIVPLDEELSEAAAISAALEA